MPFKFAKRIGLQLETANIDSCKAHRCNAASKKPEGQGHGWTNLARIRKVMAPSLMKPEVKYQPQWPEEKRK
eukprot:s840_g23.t1